MVKIYKNAKLSGSVQRRSGNKIVDGNIYVSHDDA